MDRTEHGHGLLPVTGQTGGGSGIGGDIAVFRGYSSNQRRRIW
jgi:hypothetical protein